MDVETPVQQRSLSKRLASPSLTPPDLASPEGTLQATPTPSKRNGMVQSESEYVKLKEVKSGKDIPHRSARNERETATSKNHSSQDGRDVSGGVSTFSSHIGQEFLKARNERRAGQLLSSAPRSTNSSVETDEEDFEDTRIHPSHNEAGDVTDSTEADRSGESLARAQKQLNFSAYVEEDRTNQKTALRESSRARSSSSAASDDSMHVAEQLSQHASIQVMLQNLFATRKSTRSIETPSTIVNNKPSLVTHPKRSNQGRDTSPSVDQSSEARGTSQKVIKEEPRNRPQSAAIVKPTAPYLFHDKPIVEELSARMNGRAMDHVSRSDASSSMGDESLSCADWTSARQLALDRLRVELIQSNKKRYTEGERRMEKVETESSYDAQRRRVMERHRKTGTNDSGSMQSIQRSNRTDDSNENRVETVPVVERREEEHPIGPASFAPRHYFSQPYESKGRTSSVDRASDSQSEDPYDMSHVQSDWLVSANAPMSDTHLSWKANSTPSTSAMSHGNAARGESSEQDSVGYSRSFLDRVHEKEREKASKLSAKRRERELELSRECTFKPAVNTYEVQSRPKQQLGISSLHPSAQQSNGKIPRREKQNHVPLEGGRTRESSKSRDGRPSSMHRNASQSRTVAVNRVAEELQRMRQWSAALDGTSAEEVLTKLRIVPQVKGSTDDTSSSIADEERLSHEKVVELQTFLVHVLGPQMQILPATCESATSQAIRRQKDEEIARKQEEEAAELLRAQEERTASRKARAASFHGFLSRQKDFSSRRDNSRTTLSRKYTPTFAPTLCDNSVALAFNMEERGAHDSLGTQFASSLAGQFERQPIDNSKSTEAGQDASKIGFQENSKRRPYIPGQRTAVACASHKHHLHTQKYYQYNQQLFPGKYEREGSVLGQQAFGNGSVSAIQRRSNSAHSKQAIESNGFETNRERGQSTSAKPQRVRSVDPNGGRKNSSQGGSTMKGGNLCVQTLEEAYYNQFTFSPVITPHGRSMQARTPVDMHLDSRRRDRVLREMQQSSTDKELDGMTFRPRLNDTYNATIQSTLRSESLATHNKHYLKKQELKEKERQRNEQERLRKEVSACTFRPKINASTPSFIQSMSSSYAIAKCEDVEF